MLNAETLVAGLVERGFTHVCVVPCSFASSLINAIINHPGLAYVPAASEAVACSVAAGVKMAGGKPLLIIQSSGVTNIGSCVTSLLKPYDITIAILASWRTYQEGDSEIQHQHLATALPELVAAYGRGSQLLDTASESVALEQLEAADANGDLLLLSEGSFTAVELEPEHALDLSAYPSRMAYLELLPGLVTSDTVLVGTTGNTGREMHACMHSQQNFYMAGNMGGALSIGLGAALQGRQVLVCGGDAEFVMHMGGLVTAGRYRGELNGGGLVYLVFDNASNKSTGGQRSYQEHLDYCGLARACNLHVPAETITSLEQLRELMTTLDARQGPAFLHLLCSYDPVAPRPDADTIAASKEALGGPQR